MAWEWEWGQESQDSGSSSDMSEEEDVDGQKQHNPYLHSDTENSESEDSTSTFTLPTQTHTVTFKCIGSIHSNEAQEVLSKASKTMRENGTVPTRITPEPDNEHDARAIAFVCYIDDKWQRIGYVVRECVEHVHLALSEKRILFVKLSWAKYLACWARSGPGFYAGVNVTLRGEWHRDVVRSQSTR